MGRSEGASEYVDRHSGRATALRPSRKPSRQLAQRGCHPSDRLIFAFDETATLRHPSHRDSAGGGRQPGAGSAAATPRGHLGERRQPRRHGSGFVVDDVVDPLGPRAPPPSPWPRRRHRCGSTTTATTVADDREPPPTDQVGEPLRCTRAVEVAVPQHDSLDRRLAGRARSRWRIAAIDSACAGKRIGGRAGRSRSSPNFRRREFVHPGSHPSPSLGGGTGSRSLLPLVGPVDSGVLLFVRTRRRAGAARRPPG